MDGHGAAVGGAIVDSGKFDWMAHADKFPGLTTPDESYHGITYAEKFGKEGAFITKATSQLMRDLGSIQAPQNAFLLNLGLESLHVRMARHVENGQAVAEFLQDKPQVKSVSYPGLPSDPYYAIAQKYLPHGGCGVVSFELKGGRVEYRADRYGIAHVVLGKASFTAEQLAENYGTVYDEVLRMKPAAAKGKYVKSISVSSTMGPGVAVDSSVTRAYTEAAE